jgi:hypothetical protein
MGFPHVQSKTFKYSIAHWVGSLAQYRSPEYTLNRHVFAATTIGVWFALPIFHEARLL